MIRWAGPEQQTEPIDWLWLPALVVCGVKAYVQCVAAELRRMRGAS